MQNRPSLSDPQVKAKLKALKKLGLYNGNLRKKHVSKYSLTVVKRFEDVLKGKAHVVTVKDTGGRKGHKLARAEFGQTQRVVKNKVVVGNAKPGEIARYAPKQKEITLTRFNAQGEKYTRRLIKNRVRQKTDLPELKANQAYAVPFNRWGEPSFMTFVNKDDLWAMISEYEQPGKSGKPRYADITKHVEIWTYRSARQKKAALDEIEEDDA